MGPRRAAAVAVCRASFTNASQPSPNSGNGGVEGQRVRDHRHTGRAPREGTVVVVLIVGGGNEWIPRKLCGVLGAGGICVYVQYVSLPPGGGGYPVNMELYYYCTRSVYYSHGLVVEDLGLLRCCQHVHHTPEVALGQSRWPVCLLNISQGRFRNIFTVELCTARK